jgi:hypothetical protein
MKAYISTLNTDGLYDIISYLSEFSIKAEYVNKDKYGFSRTIEFSVYDVKYRICWFKNQSELFIGENKRAARIPFRYMYYDNTYPCIGGNECIGFAQDKKEKQHSYDSEFNYGVFRIPLEID